MVIFMGLPGMLLMFSSCRGDTKPLATLPLLPLASITNCSSASRLIQAGEG